MKKLTTSLVVGGVLAASVMSSAAMAGGNLAANVGVMSDYFYRGFDQGVGATANGGLDYDLENNVTIGTWMADMTDGIEVDLYGAYSGKVNQFDYSVGFTTYQYTGDSLDNATEINLNISSGPVNLEYSVGSVDTDPSTTDYTFLALTFEKGNAYATYGVFGSDIDGSYIEVGYGLETGGMALDVALINSDKDASNQLDSNGNDTSEVSLVMSLSKSFDL